MTWIVRPSGWVASTPWWIVRRAGVDCGYDVDSPRSNAGVDASTRRFTGGAIYLSDDYGDTLRKTSAPMKYFRGASIPWRRVAATPRLRRGHSVETGARHRYWHGIDVNSGGDFIAAVAKGGQIWRSTDAGKGWSASGPTRNWGSIAVSSTGDKLAAAEMGNYSDNRYAGGSIMLSTDSGRRRAVSRAVWVALALRSLRSTIAATSRVPRG